MHLTFPFTVSVSGCILIAMYDYVASWNAWRFFRLNTMNVVFPLLKYPHALVPSATNVIVMIDLDVQ